MYQGKFVKMNTYSVILGKVYMRMAAENINIAIYGFMHLLNGKCCAKPC